MKPTQLPDHVQDLLKARYFMTRDDGYVENSWEQIARRVARVAASAETNYLEPNDKNGSFVRAMEEAFYTLIHDMVFLPNSPTLFNAGIDVDPALLTKPIDEMTFDDYVEIAKQARSSTMHQLAACFVVDVDDNIESIMDTAKDIALITKSGGGVGLNLSKLRPKGAKVHGTSGKASGPISFLKMYNTVLGTVEQGYKRRGAGMAMLNIDHPDIMEFIYSKKDNKGDNVLSFFNISVVVPHYLDTRKILEGIRNGEKIPATLNGKPYYKDGKPVYINLKEVFDAITELAWKTGDPGLYFLDKANRVNPIYDVEPIVATNPCGEQPLWPYTSCNLGSINLYHFVHRRPSYTEFDDLAFEKVVKIATRFLDNIIDVSRYPIPQIDEKVRKLRPVGLGFMGLADTLIALGMKYSSEKAREFAAKVSMMMELYSSEASVALAESRGSFELYDKSFYKDMRHPSLWIAENHDMLPEDLPARFSKLLEDQASKGKRNIATTSIAPTGSISFIAQVSSGLEPNFSIGYTRHVRTQDGGWKQTQIVIRPIIDALKNKYGKVPQDVLEEIAATQKMPKELEDMIDPETLEFATSISPEAHIAMQSAVAQWISSSVSKTINMPASSTIEDVRAIYERAFEDPYIKGLTIYRDGSLDTQVLKVESDKKEQKAAEHKEKEVRKVKIDHAEFFVTTEGKTVPKPRKETLKSVTRKFKTRKGTNFLTVTFDDNGDVVEVFLSDGREKSEIIGRLTSVATRSGVDIDEIIEQLAKVGQKHEYSRIVAENMGKAIEDFKQIWHGNNDEPVDEEDLVWNSHGWYEDSKGRKYCPVCKSRNIVIQEGCVTCYDCGFGKCS